MADNPSSSGNPVSAESNNFFSRWARRKSDVRQGKPLAEPVLVELVAVAPAEQAQALTSAIPNVVPVEKLPAAAQAPQAPPPLSLEDVKLLTKDSDFKPFMATNVMPDVRNAAMKKLFADPHFNVMDGLDTYIDDYSKFEPIPESMLRQMTSVKFLNIFSDQNEIEAVPDAALDDAYDGPPDGAFAPPPTLLAGVKTSAGPTVFNLNNPTSHSVAQSYANPNIATANSAPFLDIALDTFSQRDSAVHADLDASQPEHAHTDLRLQPDDAAPALGAGHGTP